MQNFSQHRVTYN